MSNSTFIITRIYRNQYTPLCKQSQRNNAKISRTNVLKQTPKISQTRRVDLQAKTSFKLTLTSLRSVNTH